MYDAAEGTEPIEAVLGEIAEDFRSDKNHLFVMDEIRGASELWFCGSHPAEIATYHEHFQHIDPRLQVGTRYPNCAHSDVEVIDPDEFQRSVIYNELLRPLDIRYTLFANYNVEPGVLAGQSFMRSAREGPFEGEEVRRFELLLGHLRRALRLRRVLVRAREQIQDLRRALDLVPMPVAILEASGRVVCANGSADRLFNGGNGLTVRQQKLTGQAPGDANRIAAALAQTSQLSGGVATRASAMSAAPPVVEVQRPNGRALGLVFMPLRGRHALIQDLTPARIMLVIHDPEAILRLEPTLVSRLHGLTSTEALLASWLAEGKTLSEFAEERGCSEQTARTHLKRVLEKTQTRRQADLVRLLLGTAAMHLSISP